MCALHRRCRSGQFTGAVRSLARGGHASVRPQSWHGIVLGCEHVCGVCVLGYPRAPCHVCVLPPTPPYLAWSCLGSASYLMPACMPPTPCIIHGHAHVPVDAHRPLASEYVWGGGAWLLHLRVSGWCMQLAPRTWCPLSHTRSARAALHSWHCMMRHCTQGGHVDRGGRG